MTLLGVVTEEVKSTFKGIKNGLYPVQKAGWIDFWSFQCFNHFSPLIIF